MHCIEIWPSRELHQNDVFHLINHVLNEKPFQALSRICSEVAHMPEGKHAKIALYWSSPDEKQKADILARKTEEGFFSDQLEL